MQALQFFCPHAFEDCLLSVATVNPVEARCTPILVRPPFRQFFPALPMGLPFRTVPLISLTPGPLALFFLCTKLCCRKRLSGGGRGRLDVLLGWLRGIGRRWLLLDVSVPSSSEPRILMLPLQVCCGPVLGLVAIFEQPVYHALLIINLGPWGRNRRRVLGGGSGRFGDGFFNNRRWARGLGRSLLRRSLLGLLFGPVLHHLRCFLL
mmetsp:Transcript_838/g.1934  ORF Transcript_838/g.1934 Transcript_838/m.1934 type:complete len:207 (+) Transcript_838:1624-2244(+)